jgi:murein DD-endopeptidase MepM/ murein hydrolase activator NlpD
MHAIAEARLRGAVSHLGFVALIAAGLAGCSADVSRFGESPFSNPYAARTAQANEAAGSAYRPSPPPVARIDAQQLPPPPAPQASAVGATPYASAPGRAEVTGSIHPAGGMPTGSGWSWEGGTAITVGQGETIDSLSRRYGVPASAIMQANHITASASIQAGQRLVIPRYAGAAPRNAPATRIATNATMVPAAGQPAAATPGAAPRVGPGVHVVAAGESLSAIARRYHKPRKAIARANNLAPDAKVRIGQHLVIPGMKSPAAPATPAPTAAASAPAKPPAVPRKVADASAATKPQGAAPAPAAAPGAKVATGSAAANARVAAPAAEPTADTEDGAAPAESTGSKATFRWPVRGRIITGFGPRTNGQQNDGINLSIPEGTVVKAAEDGVVAYAGNELKGYGNLVLVRHGNGFVTAYAHASELMVKRGDQVKRGQVIMRSGQTGSVTSPQLHFEIRKGATPVDPMQYLAGG